MVPFCARLSILAFALAYLAGGESRGPQFITSLAWSPSTGFLIGSDEEGLFTSSGASALARRYPGTEDIAHVVCVRAGSHGEVWIGTADQGLVVLGNGWRRQLTLAGGFPGNHVWCIAIDPSTGCAWIGTEGGLAIVDPDAQTWSMRGMSDGLPDHGITAIALSGKRVCIGTECHGLVIGQMKRDGDVSFDSLISNAHDVKASARPLPCNAINDVCFDSTERLWVATPEGVACTNDLSHWETWIGDDSLGRAIIAGSNKPPHLHAKEGSLLSETYCTCVYPGGAGGILVGHRTGGVDHLDPSSPRPVTRSFLSDGPSAEDQYARDIAVLPDGRIACAWFGAGVTIDPARPEFRTPTPPLQLEKPLKGNDHVRMRLIEQRLKEVSSSTPSPSIAALPDDWATKGDWIGRYGRWWASLEAMLSPKSYIWGAWPETIDFSSGVAFRLQPDGQPEDLRFWVHWLYTGNPNSLELPPAYADRLRRTHALPKGQERRQSECDDHGEAYGMDQDGPHIVYKLSIPAGYFLLSLYDYNKDGHEGKNKLRDYLVNIYADDAVRQAKDDRYSYRKGKLLVESRIHDFRPGVYKRFAVSGPLKLAIEVNRNHSFNTIMAGVFLDPLENLPSSWLETSSMVPDYLTKVLHRPRLNYGGNSLGQIQEQLDRIKFASPMTWAREQRLAQATLLKIGGAELTGPMKCMTIFWDNALFPDWERAHQELYGVTPRTFLKGVIGDDSTGDNRGYSLIYQAAQVDH